MAGKRAVAKLKQSVHEAALLLVPDVLCAQPE